MTTASAAEPELIVRRQGRAGRITLNRPKVINALSYEMVAPITDALRGWAADSAISLVILDGAGERGLCAGGDVISLYNSKDQGSGLARRFWADEYRLNALIGSYPKPLVALQDGIVMGGGIGLSGHASHRIVTERSMLAMPETGIGLIPDVGGTWLLSRAPGEIGVYLGLLGHRMNAADAMYAGISDTCVASARLPELVSALADTADPVSVTIAQFATAPPPSTLAGHRAAIDNAFRHETVEEIRGALAATPGDLATKARADLVPRSPLALKATLAAIRRARGLASLERALEIEYRLTVRLFERGEFIEGIRALLIDKDKSPRWKPARLDELSTEAVEALFAPLPPGEELVLG